MGGNGRVERGGEGTEREKGEWGCDVQCGGKGMERVGSEVELGGRSGTGVRGQGSSDGVLYCSVRAIDLHHLKSMIP